MDMGAYYFQSNTIAEHDLMFIAVFTSFLIILTVCCRIYSCQFVCSVHFQKCYIVSVVSVWSISIG